MKRAEEVLCYQTVLFEMGQENLGLPLYVIKRDGETVVDFDITKIFVAISKAYESVYREYESEYAQKTLDDVLVVIKSNIVRDYNSIDTIHIEDIERIVELSLMEVDLHEVARSYISFRKDRDVARMQESSLEYNVGRVLVGDKGVVNENANKDSRVYNTQRDLMAGSVAKAVGIKKLPPDVAIAHVNGDIHWHDLDYHPLSPQTNCSLINFENMFQGGFKIGNAEVESPKSVQTAAAQMAQIIANVASSQYGGTSADRLDELLAPYAKLNYYKHLKDARKYKIPNPIRYSWDKTKKDIYDAMQSLEYEINTLYTSHGQTPFTSIGFGLGQTVIEREIQKAIFRVRIGGLGAEKRTAIFPKLIYTLKRGVNLDPGDRNYDIKTLALECATKRMYPDVLSYDKIVELTGSFKVPMGCRSFLQGWKNEAGEDVVNGRLNLGVVTLNLPRIAIQAYGDKKDFWDLLEDRLDGVMKESLLYRINRCKEATPENAPIMFQYGAVGRLKPGEEVDTLFRNKRATISMGYIGLYEVATAFYGPSWENNPEAKQFTIDVLRFMKSRADNWGNEYGYHFSVYSTPSESLTDRFCRMDYERFGSIKDITDKEYYTNSFHYDVRKDPTPFEKLDFEKDYPQYCSGGFIHYCEYPNMRQNPKALEVVWDYAYDRVGYLGTNTPIDHCYECGFDGDFEPTARGFQCPQCGNRNPATCDVVKRTCGYLGNPQQRPMVSGRHKEIAARVKHVK